MSGYREQAAQFDCHGERLVGVLCLPDADGQLALHATQPSGTDAVAPGLERRTGARGAHAARSDGRRGIVVVIGGPQYRTGSHRQFVLMARHFAQAGMPVLRFDYRGMGDSDGPGRACDEVGDDLRAAISCLCAQAPQVEEVIVMGLCDGALAAALYAGSDPRVRALALFNPWVRTEATAAKATLKHYYVRRLFQRDFWRKIAGARFQYGRALASFGALLADALRPQAGDAEGKAPVAERMLAALRGFDGRVLVVLSSEDLTAREFGDLAATRPWRALTMRPGFSQRRLEGADHTFSRRVWRDQVCAMVCDWSAGW
jgi:exosortase A-associated hydrolase 1